MEVASGVEKSQRDINVKQTAGSWFRVEGSDLQLRRRAGNDVEWKGR